MNEAPETDESVDSSEVSQVSEPSEAGVASVVELPRPRVGLSSWLLFLAAVAVAVGAFLAWRSADQDPDRARAALRDAAVIEGTAAIETMNSMDHRDVDAGVAAWREVTTGVLHDQLVAMSPEEQQLLAAEGKVAEGRVVQAALTELTDRTATLIAAVEIIVSGDELEGPTPKRNRYAADLVLVGGEWKIENISQVAVTT